MHAKYILQHLMADVLFFKYMQHNDFYSDLDDK